MYLQNIPWYQNQTVISHAMSEVYALFESLSENKLNTAKGCP